MAANQLKELLHLDEEPSDEDIEFIMKYTAEKAHDVVAKFSIEEITEHLEIIGLAKQKAVEIGQPVFVTVVPRKKKNDSTDN